MSSFTFLDDKQVLEKCLMSYVVRLPNPSHTWSMIAARVVNIVVAINNPQNIDIFWESIKKVLEIILLEIIILT